MEKEEESNLYKDDDIINCWYARILVYSDTTQNTKHRNGRRMGAKVWGSFYIIKLSFT